jgi:hypothetical protein
MWTYTKVDNKHHSSVTKSSFQAVFNATVIFAKQYHLFLKGIQLFPHTFCFCWREGESPELNTKIKCVDATKIPPSATK